ncbi:HEAT repeat domain-containing protein [Ancylothrix sp. C2]|uniref:HEAT repeat domain-containing protein n=1 Tax=Ancylothrix sp. D3o TaxID=2953691 RepID=UPI0021BBACC1|nr:HEAT repeat domain-containing protein [Ancylothrix sp. D3o]MCT7952561.1 HEAT repeat domain-containing protein [Ancylothrix sp. D3o]
MSTEPDDKQLTLYAEQLANPDEAVRLQTVRTLAALSDNPKIQQLLFAGLGDASWRVRRAVVEVVSKHSSDILSASLLRSLRVSHRNASILSAVLELFVKSKCDVIPALIESLNDSDTDLRIYSALALGEQKDSRAIPALIRALDDSDQNVRYHAIDALGHLKAAEAVQPLTTIALSGDFFLAFAALDSLRRIGDPAVVYELVPLLEDEMLCTAVAETLGELGDASMAKPLGMLFNKPNAPVDDLLIAVNNLYERYEKTYQEGGYIADVVGAALTKEGAEKLIQALRNHSSPQLRIGVQILSRLNIPEVHRTLTQLLAKPALRSPAVEALVRYGKEVTPLLVEQLQSDNTEIRRAAVLALGKIGDSSAVPALTELLTNDPQTTVVTAGALASIGDRRAFDALLSLCGHPEASVRQAVVGALNSLGHPAMLNRMVDLLQDPDPLMRESAVKIAGYFAFTECVTLLLDRCHDADENVRRAAVELVPYIENGPVLPTLINALQNDTPKVRAAAARAFGQIDSSLAYSHLLSALQDSDPWVRYYAARSLGSLDISQAVDPLGAVAKNDPAQQVRLAAIDALGVLGGYRAAAILAPLTEAEADVAAAALKALGNISEPNSLPPLLRALNSSVPVCRRCAIRALGKRGGCGVETTLADIATFDFDTEIVQAAIEALASLGTPLAIEALVNLMANPIRNADCVAALAHLQDHHIEAVGRGLLHPDADVRRSVVEVLTRMKHPRSSEFLISALDDKEPAVRLAAVMGLELLGNRYAERKVALLAYTDPDLTVRRAAVAFQSP